MSKLGMPYMGSKRKLAPKILSKILADNPQTEIIYDLFGGGGAISFKALQHHQIKRVIYNEFNTGVVELLKKIKKDGITPEFCNWIDRDTFEKHKNDNDWFGGLCKVVWSFGNSQKGYLFGRDIQDDKHLLHNIVVNKCEKSLKKFNEKNKTKIKMPIKNSLFGCDYTINERRLLVLQQIKVLFDLQRLEQLEQLQRLEQLEQLQRLERLQQLQQLQRLQQLEIQNKSYEDVEINTPTNKTVIYLDPPYKDTRKYQNNIDHDKLKEYIRNNKYKIYLSSYENIYDMELVAEFKHRSILCATANNEVIERLYTNAI